MHGPETGIIPLRDEIALCTGITSPTLVTSAHRATETDLVLFDERGSVFPKPAIETL